MKKLYDNMMVAMERENLHTYITKELLWGLISWKVELKVEQLGQDIVVVPNPEERVHNIKVVYKGTLQTFKLKQP